MNTETFNFRAIIKRDPMHPGTLDPKVLLKTLKSLYKSPWGFGEKLYKIKSLSDIKVTDFFFDRSITACLKNNRLV